MPLRRASRAEPYLVAGASAGARAGVSGCGRGAASSACAAPAPRKATPKVARMKLDVRIGFFFCGSARMGYCPIPRGTNGLCVFPEIARGGARLARLPFGLALSEFLVGEFHVDGATDGIDCDDVAVPEQPDGSTHGGFGAHMADAEAAGRAREPAVGDERHLVAH